MIRLSLWNTAAEGEVKVLVKGTDPGIFPETKIKYTDARGCNLLSYDV